MLLPRKPGHTRTSHRERLGHPVHSGLVGGAPAPAAQELQIAGLAAEGLSNREIGERLYLSHRTIGTHLYRIFPKLEITSRAQLAGRLRQA